MKAYPLDYDKAGNAFVTINGAKHPLTRAIGDTIETRVMRDGNYALSHFAHLLAKYPTRQKGLGSAVGELSAQKAGHARASSMTPKQRSQLARFAAITRWNKDE